MLDKLHRTKITYFIEAVKQNFWSKLLTYFTFYLILCCCNIRVEFDLVYMRNNLS